jgi:alanine racemase
MAPSRSRAAAEDFGVSLLGVATLHEGIQLRQEGHPAADRVLSPLLRARSTRPSRTT